MDLIFSRYSSPFLFLDSLIKINSLTKGIFEIIKFKDDELTWQMYCSLLSNPMSKVKSYKDFKNQLGRGQSISTKSNSKELKSIQVKEISEQSSNILNSFKPR